MSLADWVADITIASGLTLEIAVDYSIAQLMLLANANARRQAIVALAHLDATTAAIAYCLTKDAQAAWEHLRRLWVDAAQAGLTSPATSSRSERHR
jgi:hypothetical protein